MTGLNDWIEISLMRTKGWGRYIPEYTLRMVGTLPYYVQVLISQMYYACMYTSRRMESDTGCTSERESDEIYGGGERWHRALLLETIT